MANYMESSQTEAWLKQRGVKFEYRCGIRYDELIANWSDVNQGRVDSVPRDEALIEKYAGAMENGAMFPAPILGKIVGGFEVYDGCQRLSAGQRCGQTLFNGYIIKADNPAVRASIRVCANSVLNGTAPSQEWTIAKIVDVLYEGHNYSVVDCSQWSGQPVAKIQQEIDSRDAAQWLRCQKVDIKTKPCNQKGFLASFSRLFPFNDRIQLVGVLPDLVRMLQRIKANNAEAEGLLLQCSQVSRAKGANYASLIQNRIDEVMKRPEIKGRLALRGKSHPVENALSKIQGAITAARSACEGEFHADFEQSVSLMEMLSELQRLTNEMVPREFAGKIAEAKAMA